MRLSQEALGKAIGYSQQLVWKWERGKATPDLEQAALVAKELRISLDWLAEEELGVTSESGVADDERPLLVMVREMGVKEARRRLMGLAPSFQPASNGSVDPTTSPPPSVELGKSTDGSSEPKARKKG